MVSPKNSFLDWDTTAGNNTDVGGIGILGTNAVNNFDDALRTIMSQLRSGVDPKIAYQTKSGNYTAVAADNNTLIHFTTTATLSLTAAATLGANWHVYVKARGGPITIDPNGTEQINGATTLVLPDGAGSLIMCTGSAFITLETPEAFSINPIGYFRTTTGVIIQWGSSNNASSDYAVNFPIPFPLACTSVQLTPIFSVGATSVFVCNTSNVSTTSFDIRCRSVVSGGTVSAATNLPVSWMATGY